MGLESNATFKFSDLKVKEILKIDALSYSKIAE